MWQKYDITIFVIIKIYNFITIQYTETVRKKQYNSQKNLKNLTN